MTQASDIKDEHTLAAWLKTRPREDAVVIAHRAALRVLPLWGAMSVEWARLDRVSVLSVFRCAVITSATFHVPKPVIRSEEPNLQAAYAANSAYSAYTRNAGNSAFAAQAAALSVVKASQAVSATTLANVTDLAVLAVLDASLAAARLKDQAIDIWGATREDGEVLEKSKTLVFRQLWSEQIPVWFQDAYIGMIEVWDRDPKPRWEFWRRWWDGVVTGRPLDPKLQLALVEGIDDDTWRDPDLVAARIVEIERDLASEYDEEKQSVDLALKASSLSSRASVEKVSRAMIVHRRELPPTFDTLLGYLSLEVERLQNRNYRDEDDAEEARRQINVLKTIFHAIERLQALVPERDEMPDMQAEKAEALTRLIFRRISEWPRASPGVAEDNVGELVDNSIRGTLIGGFAYLAPMVGVAPSAALVAGTVIFGGKKIVEAAKAAKGAFGP